ncbi:MAG: response regulator [Candidatus Gracilibacteria bacterium]|nr:response regulator [Candidatus Gracilibacteria bacterium]
MTKKLLIIEDDKVLNEMYALKFEKEGYEVESAYEGLDGVSKVASFNPDVILLDLMMPSMNGFETLEVIKSQTSSTCKIIIFTNIVDKEKINKAIEMGADDYLIKADTTPKVALEKVEAHLKEAELEKEEKGVKYIYPGVNHFRIKNPHGGEDIDVEINVKM